MLFDEYVMIKLNLFLFLPEAYFLFAFYAEAPFPFFVPESPAIISVVATLVLASAEKFKKKQKQHKLIKKIVDTKNILKFLANKHKFSILFFLYIIYLYKSCG